MANYIHPTAVVENDAQLGENIQIWHYTHIDSKAKIGNNVKIGQGCYVGKSAEIGNNCKIQNNVNIFTGVKIGNNVFIAPNVTFTNVKKPSPYVVAEKYEETIVKDGVSIGASATILPGITINEGAFIGAGSVVTKDVPRNATVIGNPARIMRRKKDKKVKNQKQVKQIKRI